MPVSGSMSSLLVSRLTFAPAWPCGTDTAPRRTDASTFAMPVSSPCSLRTRAGALSDESRRGRVVGMDDAPRGLRPRNSSCEFSRLIWRRGTKTSGARLPQRFELFGKQPGRQPPATHALDVVFHPRRGQFDRSLRPAVRGELVVAAPDPGADQASIASSVALAVGQRRGRADGRSRPVPTTSSGVRRRGETTAGVCWAEMRGRQEIPQRDVGPLELILGGQHVRRERRRLVRQDLGGHQDVEFLQCGHQTSSRSGTR